MKLAIAALVLCLALPFAASAGGKVHAEDAAAAVDRLRECAANRDTATRLECYDQIDPILTGTDNAENDRLLRLSSADQAVQLASLVGAGCAGDWAFYIGSRGDDDPAHTAFWSLRCKDGRSLALALKAGPAGSSGAESIDCEAFRIRTGYECFKRASDATRDPAAVALQAGKPREISLTDLKLDKYSLIGVKIRTIGVFNQAGDLSFLGDGAYDASPIMIDTHALTRDQRKALLDCGNGDCFFAFTGTLKRSIMGAMLMAESAERQ